MIRIYKEYAIGVKKLTEADLGWASSSSSQTHIGLSEQVLTFLPNTLEQRDGILIYNRSCSSVECAFSKIGNKRSTKVDSTTTNPVKSIVKQIRNIASDNNLEWILVWFALDNQVPVFWLINSMSNDYLSLKKIVGTVSQMKAFKPSMDEYFKILILIRSITKLNNFVVDKYGNGDEKFLIAKSNEHRTFVHLVLDYFRAKGNLDVLYQYFSTIDENSPIKVYKDGQFNLLNMFMYASEEEINRRNSTSKGRRWYTDIFSIKGRNCYLYVDWYPGKDNNGVDKQLMIPDFVNLIQECYGNKFVYKKSQGAHELWYINKQENLLDEDSYMESTIPQKSFDLSVLVSSIKQTGLLYEDNLLKRYACALMTKPFVILSGLAGSGKTQLALAFAHAMSESIEQQLCVVPVGADWTNREPLLGYPNALKVGEYMEPENGVLQIMMRAKRNPNKPYFLVLDEMNLSYVERYFADFLSALESNQEIPLWNAPEETESSVPSSIALPKNLFITGTINVDETTYMFSPKVLDRANVIEFKISEKEMGQFLMQDINVDFEAADRLCADMGQDFVVKALQKNAERTELAEETLLKFFKELKKVNAEFGYRSATEIYRFIANAKATAEDMSENEILDAAIVQKLLPKLHGSRKKLEPVLNALWGLCMEAEHTTEAIMRENLVYAKFPESADKIQRMMQTALDNGFTSFAEA